MKILFIHQNFPGQFKNLAPALAKLGHEVVALTMQENIPEIWNGVRLISYNASRSSARDIHPWLVDFETKVIRGEACFQACHALKYSGFVPDTIVAHHGWGESLFVKDVWPETSLGIYCEYFYNPIGFDVGFDPEFLDNNEDVHCRMRMKNVNNVMHFMIADAGISPTQFQASTYPEQFRGKLSVIHDGIDTKRLMPSADISVTLNDSLRLDKRSKVITFVNYNLEPHRGYHIFMRALVKILKECPEVRVMIVGGDKVSYGAKPKAAESWKEVFINEVRPLMQNSEWERIHFLGKLPYEQFVAVLQLTTVHVYLSYPFVLSWSLIEAMSVGAAIVASDTAPLREVISHNDNGVLVSFFDVGALADAVLTLLGDEATRRKLGESAREFAIKNYDLESICLPKQIKWVLELSKQSQHY
jgi:glycosyltransferase involved in cell wall biosynthesis